MKIEKILKEYPIKKSYVSMTLSRIEAWNYTIEHEEILDDWNHDAKTRELGMPGAPLRSTASPVERVVIDRELKIETIQKWIKDEQARIFFKKLEVDQVEAALATLTKEEMFVIEKKYFEKLFWANVEIKYNEEFRKENCITFEILKKNNKVALQKLTDMLEPFYEQFDRI